MEQQERCVLASGGGGIEDNVGASTAQTTRDEEQATTPATGKGEQSLHDEAGGRIIRGTDIPNEDDAIKFKWNAIFHSFTAEQKEQLALDEVSMYSITDTRSAHNTSKVIEKYVGAKATITDGCAAAGGNTFAFAQHFAHVNAVELNAQRFQLLNDNLKVLTLHEKVKTHNADFLDLIGTLNQDVVFLDPPWGGMAYTEKDKITLIFGGLPLAEVCEMVKPHARYIALKLPLNYDLDHLAKGVTSSIVRADDRCARKQLFVILDTSGREPRERSGGYKRERDDRPAPWSLKRKS